ncbi:hypothetical protein [Candidatus Protochlamydia phocaeensis]|uniref:hypothetical protein n=1 Tax=Candidatus Protochlamydia phocaeensis TaxID=1414722 RepID=UPI000A91610B|nr:hypothetical protein [Candidatus Protochlamydia phocaeensis]
MSGFFNSWWFLILIAVGVWFFGGFENEEEKENKILKQRIQQLESDVDYLLHKVEKKRY